MPRRKPKNIYRKNGLKFPDINPNNGYVNVIGANRTDTQQLTWDFDCPISELFDGSNLGLVPDATLAVSVPAFIDTIVEPTAVTDASEQVSPGQSRIVADYAVAVDSSKSMYAFRVSGAGNAQFRGRTVGAQTLGQISEP